MKTKSKVNAVKTGLIAFLIGVSCNPEAEVKTLASTRSQGESSLLFIERLTKLVASPGESLRIFGSNFGPKLFLESIAFQGRPMDGSQLEASGWKFSVESPSVAVLDLPSQLPFGFYELKLSQEGEKKNINIFSNGGKTDFPISTDSVDEICTGKKFYDEYGVLKEGTKVCIEAAMKPCAADGATECTVTGDFVAVEKKQLKADQIAQAWTIGGVDGTAVVESHTDCLADGATACVATQEYPAALSSELSNKILSGQTVAGVAGKVTLPSIDKVLSGTQYGVDGTMLTGTLTLPSAAHVRVVNGPFGVPSNSSIPTLENCSTDGAIGCVAVTGFPSAKVADFDGSDVKNGKTIAGVPGSLASCSTDGQTNCVTTNLFPAAAVSGFSSWNLRSGTSLAGIVGALKTNCRNGVNSTYYNYDGALSGLPTTLVTTGTALDNWDTINDQQGFPPSQVTGWPADTNCDSSGWSDVTTTDGGTSYSSCGTGNTCIYQDKISNLRVTGVLAAGYNSTSTVSPASMTWAAAIEACDSSTYGGYSAGTWRVPTQKEMLSLYIHGIASIANQNFISLSIMQANLLWTSTTSLDSVG